MNELEFTYRKIQAKVTVDSTNGCHLCAYSPGSHGYSQVSHAGKNALCHRVIWEYFNGAIPDGLTVDHECHVRRCVNIEHLRLKTNVENASDNGMATRTHCPSGHVYSPENTREYTDPQGYVSRRCIQCQNDYNASRYSPEKVIRDGREVFTRPGRKKSLTCRRGHVKPDTLPCKECRAITNARRVQSRDIM